MSVTSVIPHLVECLDGFHASVGLEVGDFVSWLADLGDAESTSTSEHNDVKKGVGACGKHQVEGSRKTVKIC